MAIQDFTPEELKTEEWRVVPSYPDYDVSNLGRVRSRTSNPVYKTPRAMRLLSGWLNSLGYRQVTITRNGQVKGVRVHRLVLEAFVGPCPKGMESRHGNGVRDDNRLTNLSWDTHYTNIQDQKAHGTFNLPVGWHKYHENRRPKRRRS